MSEDIEKKLIEAKAGIKSGDNAIIADIVGCTQEHVSRVFNGKKNADTKKGRKIIVTALRIIESRKMLKEKPLTDQEYQEWLISKGTK